MPLFFFFFAPDGLPSAFCKGYTKLAVEIQAKNIAAWTPVGTEIFHGSCEVDEKKP
jgi:hypothetical protein